VNPIVDVTEHALDNGSNNIDSNGIIREGGEEDFGTSEPSKSSELLLELHENRSDDPEKTETKVEKALYFILIQEALIFSSCFFMY
jgi:hypothetical protein